MNRINMLMRKNGTECRDEDGMAKEIAHYFENLFTTSSLQACLEILDKVPRIIFEPMNRSLTKPVEDLKIKQSLFSMHLNKAPGLDGMTPLFYQKFWNIIGHGICRVVKAFFYSINMLTTFNHTLISLIPKVKNPIKVSEFSQLVYKM